MTLDEAIKHAEEVANEKENLAKTYETFKDFGNHKSSITSGHEKCLMCAEEHRQLAEWLKELTEYKQLNKHCDYCYCDKEGYVKPIDRRCHVFVDANIHEGNIVVNFNGSSKKYPIKYCPMCGRRLEYDG